MYDGLNLSLCASEPLVDGSLLCGRREGGEATDPWGVCLFTVQSDTESHRRAKLPTRWASSTTFLSRDCEQRSTELEGASAIPCCSRLYGAGKQLPRVRAQRSAMNARCDSADGQPSFRTMCCCVPSTAVRQRTKSAGCGCDSMRVNEAVVASKEGMTGSKQVQLALHG